MANTCINMSTEGPRDPALKDSDPAVQEPPPAAPSSTPRMSAFSCQMLTTAVILLLAVVLHYYLDPLHLSRLWSTFATRSAESKNKATAMTSSAIVICPTPDAEHMDNPNCFTYRGQ